MKLRHYCIPNRINPLEDTFALECGAMQWKTVRSAFIQARGTTPQHVVAKAGGLRQNAISKIENNAALGPAVETFLKAVEGLGLPVSVFFRQIEDAQTGDSLGQFEKINVRLITEGAQHNNAASSGTQGVVDAISATLHQTADADLPDAVRLILARALVETATRLMPTRAATSGSHRSPPAVDAHKSKRGRRRA